MITLLLIDDHPLVQVALDATLARAPFPCVLLPAGEEMSGRQLLG